MRCSCDQQPGGKEGWSIDILLTRVKRWWRRYYGAVSRRLKLAGKARIALLRNRFMPNWPGALSHPCGKVVGGSLKPTDCRRRWPYAARECRLAVITLGGASGTRTARILCQESLH